MRAAMLLLLCGCQGVFGLRHVEPPPVDAPIAGLVAYYPMDDLGPTDACMTDAQGGPSGRCNSGMPALVPTIHGMGYQFDGAAYITVAGTPEAMPIFTVTEWISIVSPLDANLQCPANRVYGPAGANSWQMCVAAAQVYFNAGDGQFFDDGSSITLGGWHQLAMTYDGAMMQGFLDGRPLQSQPAHIFIDAQPLVVGVDLDSGTPTAQYRNVVDELAIYDRVLSATELAQLYQM